MKSLDFVPIDADNHFYEPHDCCTRHLEAKFRSGRACHVAKGSDGVDEWRFGDRPIGFHRATRDWVLPPGAYRPFMSGKGDTAKIPRAISSETPAFRDREARLATLDKQGLQATIMLPSFGVAFEAEILDDRDALIANVRAFNRFIEDDWGYAYRDRIFALPLITLADRDGAIAELERVAALGARGFILRPGPIYGRSPADPWFDPFWARAEEAGLLVALHIGVSGYTDFFGRAWGEDPNVTEQTMTPFQFLTCFGARPAQDTFAALVLHGLFDRFPRLRAASIENGSDWVPGLVKSLEKVGRVAITSQGGAKASLVRRPPDEVFKEHVYVAPFFEDDVYALVDTIGAERVLFGSDWPHPEGVAAPLDFLEEVEALPAAALRRVMRDNTAGILRIG
ncbi:MAG: amidohydrolase family protein [Myxococcota bacterium]